MKRFLVIKWEKGGMLIFYLFRIISDKKIFE